MKKKPEVGQIVYDRPCGDRARLHRNVELNAFVVKKVGRKYFYAGEKDCAGYQCRTYFISNWAEAYKTGSADSILYESKQEYQDELLRCRIVSKVSKILKSGPWVVALEDLRAAWKIFEKYDKEER